MLVNYVSDASWSRFSPTSPRTELSSYRLLHVTYLEPAFMQHVLYIPERHRTLDAKHRSQAYDLGAGFGVAQTAGSLSSGERVQTAGRSRPTF